MLPLKAQTMNEAHSLTALWKQYEEATKADRPQLQAEILGKIKEEAIEKRLPVDFYDAASEYVNVVQRRDWKQRDQLRKDLRTEVEAFNEPIVTFRWMADWDGASTDRLWKYVAAHTDGFQGLTPAFHRNVDNYLNGGLKPFIRSDKEYVLWNLLKNRTTYNIEKDEIYQMLAAEVKGVYPNDAALEYYVLSSKSWPESREAEKIAAYQAMADKYAGKAVSLFPRAELLHIQMTKLSREKGSSADFQHLYEAAQALENERKNCKGDEAKIVKGLTYPKSLCEQLTSKELNVSVQDGTIYVVLRNLSGADVSLRTGKKTVKKWKLKNTQNSFYKADSLKVALPTLPDESYTIEAVNGKMQDLTYYSQHTLSIATRKDSRGHCVYVTDYQTGIPLRSVTLRLYKGDKEMARSNLKLDGFTPLPAALEKALDESAEYWLEAESGKRKSERVSIEDFYGYTYVFAPDYHCNIYKDRGAYNPGDVVNFKAVVYYGDPRNKLEVCPDKAVKVNLYDSEGNLLESKDLVTNEFGAVSGAFTLPTGLRNGIFRLQVENLTSDYFRVDEFVLPNFTLTFDKLDQLYLVGDSVPVSGRLISYSGHPLDGALIRAKVSCYGSVIFEEEVPVQDDNSFIFSYLADRPGFYNIALTVTDATGETQSFNIGHYVSDNLGISIQLPEAADANIGLVYQEKRTWMRARPASEYVIEKQTLELNLNATDNSGNYVPLPVSYELLKAADGSLVAKGQVPSGEELLLELPGSGLYVLQAKVTATKPDGKEVKVESSVYVLAALPGDRTLEKGVKRVFIPGELVVRPGAALTARLGSAEGDAYTVVTVYGAEREVLDTRTLRVADGTFENISYAYQDSWSDAVRLQIFYFLNGECYIFERQYRREKDKYTLPLTFTRFHDKAYPGMDYSFSLQTAPDVEALVAAWDKSLDAISPNNWNTVKMRDLGVESVNVSFSCGGIAEGPVFNGPGPVFYKLGGTDERSALPLMAMAVKGEAVMEEYAAAEMDDTAPAGGSAFDEISVRSDFAPALCFQPHLRPDENGTLHFDIHTSDKLSTYYVRVYTHDKAMRNAIIEQEMVVSLPVKASILEPSYLYVGDGYDIAVTVSSVVDQPVKGCILLSDGRTEQQIPVTVPAGKSLTQSFHIVAEEPGEMTLKAGFKADDFSDAVQVTIPVYPAAQVLTESHSAVLRAGEDRDALIKRLEKSFVNVPASQATLKEITVLDMVKDAIPDHVVPSGRDVLSLSEAWYIRLMASRLGMENKADDDLLNQILACRNQDGGFGWFEGMNSSPVITAVVLERFAKLRDRGFDVPDVTTSVKYLDNNQFSDTLPVWRGWLSDAQYMHVRAMYARVPFTEKPASQAGKKHLEQFQKDARNYLTPDKRDGRGLQGQILAKSRRVLTLRHLLANEGGLDLAKAWGVSFATKSKIQSSLQADITYHLPPGICCGASGRRLVLSQCRYALARTAGNRSLCPQPALRFAERSRP